MLGLQRRTLSAHSLSLFRIRVRLEACQMGILSRKGGTRWRIILGRVECLGFRTSSLYACVLRLSLRPHTACDQSLDSKIYSVKVSLMASLPNEVSDDEARAYSQAKHGKPDVTLKRQENTTFVRCAIREMDWIRRGGGRLIDFS